MKKYVSAIIILIALGVAAPVSATNDNSISSISNITAEKIYGYANENNLAAIKDVKDNINITDNDGNTALCLSIIKDDKDAYALLEKEGADTNAACVKAVLAANKTFLGLGKKGWLSVAAGGVILAASGGSGGGSGGGTSAPVLPVLDCNHGSQTGAICTCEEGWEGETCEQPKTCASDKYVAENSCANGYETNYAEDCISGNNHLYSCKPAACISFVESCKPNQEYVADECMSGETKKYKCRSYTVQCAEYNPNKDECLSCLTGFYLDAGKCLENTVKHCLQPSTSANICDKCEEGYAGATCTECVAPYYAKDKHSECVLIIGAKEKTSNNSAVIMKAEYAADTDVYGVKSNYQAKNTTSKIDITNENPEHKGTIYGLSGISDASNSGTINITTNGLGEIYGVKSEKSADNTNGENSVGTIEINNNNPESQAGVYGLKSNTDMSPYVIRNAYGEGSTGNIKITSFGLGSLYGMLSEASGVRNSDSKNSVGTIKLTNYNSQSSAAVYGMYSKKSAAINVNQEKGQGTIIIKDYGNGEIYGLKSDATNTASYNANGVGAIATIDITHENASKSEKDIFGVYSQRSSLNAYKGSNDAAAQGTIKIHNKTAENSQNNVYGIYSGTVGAYNAGDSLVKTGKNIGVIEISNIGGSNIYGISGNSEAVNANKNTTQYGNEAISEGTIIITNIGNGHIFGVSALTSKAYNVSGDGNTGKINIKNEGNGNVYGVISLSNNTQTANVSRGGNAGWNTSKATGIIDIQNIGNGDVYGIKSSSQKEYSDAALNVWGEYGEGLISIINEGTGDVYGISSFLGKVYNAYDANDYSSIGKIWIYNKGESDTYGIKSDGNVYNARQATGYINIISKSNKTAYGLYSSQTAYNNYGSSGDKIAQGNINIANINNGNSIGMYGKSAMNNKYGDITIHNLGDGTAVGMYANGGTATNFGDITIDRESYTFTTTNAEGNETSETYTASNATGGKAIGIYGANGAKITNSGTITINGADEAYGIWAEDNTITISNSGTIIIDDIECKGYECAKKEKESNKQAIVLNGGKLFQDGKLISTESINLAAMDGDIIASATTEIVTPEALSGVLKMNSNIVTSGFEKTYTTKGTIQAGDTSDLKLQSQSAMFGAQLAENGSDINLTMKSFNDVVKNQSLAAFLEQNYTAKNNEALFSNIKSIESLAALNDNLDDLMGKDMFSRFAFEDLTVMRELNFDINNKLFNNTEDYISVGGSTSSFAFSGNSRYSLTNMKSGKRSMGISVAFSDVNSDDGDNHNRRYDKMYNISMPMGYQTNGFNLVTTPRIGYSYGTYDRRGFSNQNYDGTVEKQMFALMNEARYPLQLGGWTVSPSVELNFMDYRISGHETAKDYALNIKSQDNYSIEAGFGLYANKETKFSKNSSLNFNSGVALYHEFADPYKMKLGMQGMDGTFTIRDENRSDNRAVVRSGFEFNYDNISVAGNVMSYIDREYQTNATLDFKFGF